MQFGFQFDTFTIPTGATTGARIVFDGINGTMTVYDTNNKVRIRIGLTNAIELSSGDAQESLLSDIQALVLGAGNTRRLETVIESPKFAGRNRSGITLDSESFDGTIDSLITLLADNFNFSSIGVQGDIKYDGVSLPRGLVASGRFSSTGNDSARAAGVATDMTVTVALKANRLYKVTVNAQFNLGTAGAVYAEELDHDGAIVGRFARQVPAETVAGSTLHYVGTTVDYVPSVDDASAVLTVENAAGSGGTITAQPPTSGPRSLTVVDSGAV